MANTTTTPRVSELLLAEIRFRRLVGFCFIGVLLCLDAYATGFFGGSERAIAIARSIVLPGLPLLEWHAPLGAVLIITALAAVAAWLRWGLDWSVVLVMFVCVMLAAFVMPLHHPNAADTPRHLVTASHEFTVVLVVFALVTQLRLLIARLPGSDWIKSHLPQGWQFPAVDTARAAAITLIAHGDTAAARAWLKDPRLRKRAGRINAWARFRQQTDPLCGAHAPLRAALSLANLLDDGQTARLCRDARSRLAGVPDSEPTWVRPLDGMLVALALCNLGEVESVQRWRWIFDTRFALRHGRRPAALHAPSMLSIGTARAWEHAAATALAHRAGWIDAGDWPALRPRCLGAAAGGHKDPDTIRLIAAGKLWAVMTEDLEALEILGRRTLGSDQVAGALNHLAVTERKVERMGAAISGGARENQPGGVTSG